MAIKTIEYNVNLEGITPLAEQFAGTQGDHKVTRINFTLSDELYDLINAAANNGSVMYRFDLYDGEGGIWQSETSQIKTTVGIDLEQRHTRFGGKIMLYLVITVLFDNNKTEVELYSFPAILKFKNRPDGIYKDGENYESVTTLVEIAKESAIKAYTSAEQAEVLNRELQQNVAAIEHKLKNGDFNGVGVKNAEIVDDKLIITYTDNTSQNLGNVKGVQGPRGEKGDKGDMPDVSGFVEKVQGNTMTDEVYAVGSAGEQKTVEIEDTDMYAAGATNFGNSVPRRKHNGNLQTLVPTTDLECANKKYVDDIVGDIETALDELHNYAQSLLGGEE